ncbi:uncharacterized protein LOC142339761 [Convolutriloba macropyga]|uniref:uncharacterized protein LOC142339761 n=1 Tax=Convolutriloba macropyga TaxID=536237 RepID=UPI003F525B29
MQDSVEELHNGFFCISDPTAIAEIPHDDFRRPKEDDDLMPSPMQAVSPEPSPDHKFLANSISRADWSIESFSSTNFGNSNPLARLSGLPQLSEVVEVDGWRFGPNVIYRSIDLLKNYYRFNDVLRMGVKYHFWAFCRNLCALHGYYVRAFIYDLKDLESEVDSSEDSQQTTACSSKLAEGFFCGLQTALENVTELMREDRFNAWRGLLTAALAFIHKWNVPTESMETLLNSYVEKLEFAGAFHAVLFEMLLDDDAGQSDPSNPSSTADYICSLLSPSFLLNTIESTFTQRHDVLKGLYHGSSIKNWSKKKTTELTKFVRELHDDDISKEKKQRSAMASSSLASVQISTQSLLNAMDGSSSQSTVTVFSCGHVAKSALQDVCRYCN